MIFARTFNLTRLYHKFLKPKGIPIEKLPLLVTQLYEHEFIDLIQTEDLSERYTETEKLSSRQNRDELFKIVQGLV